MSKQQVSRFNCYVNVRGEASNPEDEGLPGVYLVEVTTSAPVDLQNLTATEQHRITEAVLDEFHNHQGIEVLADFEITAYVEDGREVVEDAEAAADEDPFEVSADYGGSLDTEDLPEALSFLLATDDSSSYPLRVNERQLATILAALRYWQREGLLSGGDEQDIATNGDALKPLNVDEIDDLCEAINSGGTRDDTKLQYLDLCTNHVSEETMQGLDDLDCSGITIAPYEYGAFVSVPGDVVRIDELGCPEDLKVVLRHARKEGCDIVRFDSDAQSTDALPCFNW